VNLLHRYIFKQVVVATAFAVAIFVFVLVLGNVMREVLDLLASGRLDLFTFLYLLVLLIPGVVPYALPLGLLTAVLLVVGRLCAQREYTAMRSAGLSLWSLAAPVLLASCLGMLFCLFINFEYAPAADEAFKSALINLARNDPLSLFQAGRDVREFPGYVVNIGGREGTDLSDIWVWVLDEHGDAKEFVRARHGELDYDHATDQLIITLHHASALQYKAADPSNMTDITPSSPRSDDFKIKLPLGKLLGPVAAPFKLSLLTLGELLRERDLNPPNNDHPTAKEKTQWRMDVQMQIQRDFAAAFSVMALALFGLPLALQVGRAENFVNLALALGLALGYYFLLFSLTLLRGHPELRPDLLLWIPNILFEGLGVFLLYRAAQK
jgi:lipopolysaccharide export system permease protein